METHFLYDIPIALLLAVTGAICLSGIEVGRRLGIYRRERGGESGGAVGSSVAATLGLLAFILAFTFNIASSRYDARKQLVIDGANAIGTCFMRTEFLPEAERAEARRLLRKYVGLRADVGNFASDTLDATLSRTKAIQEELWKLVVVVGKNQPTPLTALFAASCNQVIDIHEERVTKGLANRIPGPLWLLLYLVSMVSMVAVGYHSGLDSDRRSVGALLLAMAFSVVLVTIADLDDGSRGSLRINQWPIENLLKDMGR